MTSARAIYRIVTTLGEAKNLIGHELDKNAEARNLIQEVVDELQKIRRKMVDEESE